MGRTDQTAESAVIVEFRQQAREYGPDALKALALIMNGSSNDTARITAAREILDRAYGKTAAPLSEQPERERVDTIRYINDWRGAGEEDL